MLCNVIESKGNMKTAIYIRVSTQKQVTDGLSLENQLQKLNSYCEYNNMDVIDTITDEGISGKTTNRKGYQRLIELVNSKSIDCVCVYSLSRFMRNTVETLQAIELFNKKDVAFHSLTEKIDTTTAIGKFFLTTIASLNTLEREQISERTRDVLQFKIANNQRAGQIPFGKMLDTDGETLINEPNEQKAIQLIIDLRAKGLTYNAIAKELEQRNIQNKAGRVKWNETQISRILKRNVS
jgi:site-specific DNA recombinase